MYIKSIDEAVRKAISEAAHIFKDGDVERIVKEACEKANQRISIKMPVTISTPNEPWIYISSTLTADRNFELFVIVNLTDVAEDYLRDTQFEATRKIIAGRGSTIDNKIGFGNEMKLAVRRVVVQLRAESRHASSVRVEFKAGKPGSSN